MYFQCLETCLAHPRYMMSSFSPKRCLAMYCNCHKLQILKNMPCTPQKYNIISILLKDSSSCIAVPMYFQCLKTFLCNPKKFDVISTLLKDTPVLYCTSHILQMLRNISLQTPEIWFYVHSPKRFFFVYDWSHKFQWLRNMSCKFQKCIISILKEDATSSIAVPIYFKCFETCLATRENMMLSPVS